MTQPATPPAHRRRDGVRRWLTAGLLLAAVLGAGDRSAAEDSGSPTWVENPEYLAWRSFKPGAWASHEARLTEPSVNAGRISTGVRTWTERLEQVSDERLVLTFTMTTRRGTGPRESAGPPIRREIEHWVREQTDPWSSTTRRADTLTIQSRRVECERSDVDLFNGVAKPPRSASPQTQIGQHDQATFWRSASVPGGLVQATARSAKLLADGSETLNFSAQTELTGWGSQ